MTSATVNLSSTITQRIIRILIIHDDEEARATLKKYLSLMLYQVAEVSNIVEAESTLEKRPFDILILSMSNTSYNYTEFIRRVKINKRKSLVILISQKKRFDAMVECSAIGGDDYLTIPLEQANVIKVVSRAVEALLKNIVSHASADKKSKTKNRVIAGYEILSVLGRGNMGVVYLAQKNIDGVDNQFALKVLNKPSSLSEDHVREMLERFLREAESSFGIRHRNVVGIMDYGLVEEADQDHIPYIVMEYVQGYSLRQIINRPNFQLNYQQKGRIIRQIAYGLAMIHLHGICHRDIKPENIMLTDKLFVKISDFGIARLPNSELTHSLKLMGTPAYMAPESFSSAKIDYLADLFSLGVLTYELLLNRRPFQGISMDRLRQSIKKEAPVHPRKLDLNIPAEYINLLSRLLKKDPQERYHSAADVVLVLDEYLNQFETPSDTSISLSQRTVVQDAEAIHNEPTLVADYTVDTDDNWR